MSVVYFKDLLACGQAALLSQIVEATLLGNSHRQQSKLEWMTMETSSRKQTLTPKDETHIQMSSFVFTLPSGVGWEEGGGWLFPKL